VPRRNRQPQHVGEGPPVPVRDRAGKTGDLRRQDGFTGDDPVKEGDSTLVVAFSQSLDKKASGKPTRKPDLNPASRLCLVSQALRDQVVEKPVQVRQRDIDRNPGDRQLDGRNRLGLACPR
jgi:hypothetical protein